MSHCNLLAPDIQRFYKLSLFICHLFIDGNFQTGHILFDQSAFDSRLITAIDSTCSQKISWMMTDITLPRNTTVHSDHTVQLIFLNPDHLMNSINDFEIDLLAQRLFVFHSNDKKKIEDQSYIFGIVLAISGLNSFILHHSFKDDSIEILWLLNNNDVSAIELKMVEHLIIKPVKSKNQDSILNEEFDPPSGEIDRMWPMVVGIPCDLVQVGSNLKNFRNEIPYWPNFLHHIQIWVSSISIWFFVIFLQKYPRKFQQFNINIVIIMKFHSAMCLSIKNKCKNILILIVKDF